MNKGVFVLRFLRLKLNASGARGIGGDGSSRWVESSAFRLWTFSMMSLFNNMSVFAFSQIFECLHDGHCTKLRLQSQFEHGYF